MSAAMAALTLSLAAAAPPPAEQPALCAGLQQALDAGPDMAAIRKGPGAAPTRGTEAWNVKRVWDDAVALPGAREVRVRQIDDLIGGRIHTLTAVFGERTAAVEPLRPVHADLAARIGACLGPGWKRREIDLAGTAAHVGFSRDRAMVDVTITQQGVDPDAKDLLGQVMRSTSWVQVEIHHGLWD